MLRTKKKKVTPPPVAEPVAEPKAKSRKQRFYTWLFDTKRGSLVGFLSLVVVVCSVVIPLSFYVEQLIQQGKIDSLKVMTEEVGIVNGDDYDLVMAGSVDERSNINGSFLLFGGSLSSSIGDTLRMGYTSPDGVAYILSVPIAKIEFNVVPDGHGGSFEFTSWEPRYNLQENIESDTFEKMVIHLSKDEYNQLVRG